MSEKRTDSAGRDVTGLYGLHDESDTIHHEGDMSETKELGDILMDAQGGLVLLYRKAWQALRQHCEARGDNEMAQAMLYFHKVIIGEGKDIPDERDSKLTAAEQRESDIIKRFGNVGESDSAQVVERLHGQLRGAIERAERAEANQIQPWDVVLRPTGENRIPTRGEVAADGAGNFIVVKAEKWLDPRPIYRRLESAEPSNCVMFRKTGETRIARAGESYSDDGQSFISEPRDSLWAHPIYRRIAPAEPSGAFANKTDESYRKALKDFTGMDAGTAEPIDGSTVPVVKEAEEDQYELHGASGEWCVTRKGSVIVIGQFGDRLRANEYIALLKGAEASALRQEVERLKEHLASVQEMLIRANARMEQKDNVLTRPATPAAEAAQTKGEQPAKKTVQVSIHDDDVAVAGPAAPPVSRIDELLSLLATIRSRFGNTTVTFSLRWGGSALGTQDVQAGRIQELEMEVERLKAAAANCH